MLKDLQKDLESYNNLLHSIDKSLTIQKARKVEEKRESFKDVEDYFEN